MTSWPTSEVDREPPGAQDLAGGLPRDPHGPEARRGQAMRRSQVPRRRRDRAGGVGSDQGLPNGRRTDDPSDARRVDGGAARDLRTHNGRAHAPARGAQLRAAAMKTEVCGACKFWQAFDEGEMQTRPLPPEPDAA